MTYFIEEVEENDIFEGYSYGGCIAHPNGCIYGIPYNASRVFEYNPATNTTRLVGDDLGRYGSKWWGGTLGPDNCIYGSPSDADWILKYDPTTETTTLVGDPVDGDGKYHSAISVPGSNFIYFIPYDADRILRYNIIDGTTSFIGDTFDSEDKWNGACLSKVDGYIYCVPFDHAQVLKINPTDGSTTLIGEEYDFEEKWRGCVEAPDGYIYFSPLSASNFLKLDVRTGTTSLVGEVEQPTDGYGWLGCVSSIINGNMYVFTLSYRAERELMFDIRNESVHEVGLGIRGEYIQPATSFSSIDGDAYYSQPAISSIDGNAYAIPHYNSKAILKIDFSLLQTIHQAIQVKGIPWTLLQSIAESDIDALEQGDSNTALLPFMIAAERGDDHEEVVDSLASLTLTYQLLSMKPAVMNHYVSAISLKCEIQRAVVKKSVFD